MDSLVSVIIPCHNRAEFIGRAVKSVQNQSYESWELIIVDDGSTDDTVRIAQELARLGQRTQVMEMKQNRGAQAARNAGIRIARGDWVAFLDSDDEWLPDSLGARLEVAARDNVEVVHSECLVVRYPEKELKPIGMPPLAGDAYEPLLRGPGPMFQGLLVRRPALERIGYLDESIISYQEWDTFIRLAGHYALGFVAVPTFIYHCHSGSTISQDSLREARGYEQVTRKHRAEIVKHVGWGALAEHYRRTAAFYKKSSHQKLALEVRAKAFLCDGIAGVVSVRPALGRAKRRVSRFLKIEQGSP